MRFVICPAGDPERGTFAHPPFPCRVKIKSKYFTFCGTCNTRVMLNEYEPGWGLTYEQCVQAGFALAPDVASATFELGLSQGAT